MGLLLPDTVAVKVTDWPEPNGLLLDASATLVAALLTTWDRADDVLPLKVLSPGYTAVIE